MEEKFQTPDYVANYMASLIPNNVKTILEPTPGIGNIVKSIKNKGPYDITAADDFFKLDTLEKYDCIVMNPPFSSKYAFGVPESFQGKGMRLGYYILTECMKMSDHIIALMPWFTLSDSDIRLRFLKSFGIKSLTSLPRKTFNYARIQTVVIELDKGYTGNTIFKVFGEQIDELIYINRIE
jgi:type I restriction-modification system DNA methylase subunit